MNKRLVKSLIIFAVAAFSFVGMAMRQTDYQNVRVAKVVDGDTIELDNGRLVRYIGIDCPEFRKKTATGWKESPEPFSVQGKQLNEAYVAGREVRLEFDVQKEDKYKRLLAYCFVKDGDKEVMVQVELLRRGLAYLYTFPPNVKYVDWLVGAMQEAKGKKRGVWSVDLSVDSKDAAKFMDQRKIVTGLVKRARKADALIRLEMDGLVLVIFKNDLMLFTREGIDPAKVYQARKVRVFGKIKEYKGKPEIIVSNPWQIEIVE